MLNFITDKMTSKLFAKFRSTTAESNAIKEVVKIKPEGKGKGKIIPVNEENESAENLDLSMTASATTTRTELTNEFSMNCGLEFNLEPLTINRTNRLEDRRNYLKNFPSCLPSEIPQETGSYQFIRIMAVGTTVREQVANPVYVIEVKSAMAMPSKWKVYRRISDFAALHHQLHIDYPTGQIPLLPVPLTTFTPFAIAAQIKLLEEWLKTVLEEDAELLKYRLYEHPSLRSFFIHHFDRMPTNYSQFFNAPDPAAIELSSDLKTLRIQTPKIPGGTRVSNQYFYCMSIVYTN
jgi:hypothetical protein